MKRKKRILGLGLILVVLAIGISVPIVAHQKSKKTPAHLLIVSDKDYALGDNIQTPLRFKKRHVVINQPQTDIDYINDFFETIKLAAAEDELYESTLLVDWNASLAFDQYLNFYISTSVDENKPTTVSYVYDLKTEKPVDVSAFIKDATIKKYDIKNDGSLQLLKDRIITKDKTFKANEIPDILSKDYGNIKPTPPPVVVKPKPKPQPKPQPKPPVKKDKIVAFTFDDGPSAKYTSQVMDIAQQYNARVTFFALGSQIQKFPQVAKEVVDRGHQLASHTYDHHNLTQISKDEQKNQLAKTDSIIREASGYSKDIYIRPPYGAFNKQLLKDSPRVYINWDVDTLDWKSRDANSVCQSIVKDTKPGSVILMHDIYESTVEGFRCGIEKLAQEGYKFVTVEELFNHFGTKVKNGNLYRHP